MLSINREIIVIKQLTFIILHIVINMTIKCVVEKPSMINECTKN